MDQNICRLCIENVGVYSLFDLTDSNDIRLCEKITYCGKTSVVQGDGLPAHICVYCEKQLAATYSFLIRCEHTEKQLRALQVAVKDECDNKYTVKTEDFYDNHAFDDPYDFPPIEVKEEEKTLRKSKFKTKRKYVSIKRKPYKGKPSECEVCGRICNNTTTLAAHMRSHSNERPYACSSCDKRYKDNGTLKRHFERNHDIGRTKSIICEHCGKCFYSKSDCKIHMRIHTGETPYACTNCPARFSQIGTLQRHIIRHTGERSHMCTKCSKKFPTREQLKTHYLVHSNERKHKCPFCEVTFKTNNNMRKHIRMHTSDTKEKFVCDYCGRSFLLKGNLRIHITKLHSSKSGYCIECSKHCPNIELHMWKHAGLRTIKCDLCPSTFFDLKGLSTHVSFRHKSADKYHCPMDDCTLKFPSQAMVEYHVMRYHKSMKPFSCDKCPRSFYRKSDMVRHKRGTHKEYFID